MIQYLKSHWLPVLSGCLLVVAAFLRWWYHGEITLWLESVRPEEIRWMIRLTAGGAGLLYGVSIIRLNRGLPDLPAASIWAGLASLLVFLGFAMPSGVLRSLPLEFLLVGFTSALAFAVGALIVVMLDIVVAFNE